MDDVKRLEQAIATATTYTNQIENVNTAIFVGNTRSGKSSLINYLIGNKLVGEKIDSYGPIAIKKADDSPGPKIGLGYTSETIIPTHWPSPKLPGLVVWDVPGFDDNRGPVQDIVNSFYINGLFKNVASAKIVAVVDINNLMDDNVRSILNVFKAVENLLREKMKDCLASVAVIFTKVPDVLNETRVDKNLVCETLQNQLLSSSEIDMSAAVKDLVQYLIHNNQNIGFFKRPEVGEVTDATVDDGIVSAICNAQSIDKNVLQQITPSVAEASKVFLFEIREKLTFNQVFAHLQNSIDSVINEKMGRFEIMQHCGTTRDQLLCLQRDLTEFQGKILHSLNSALAFEPKLNSCKLIDSTVQNYIDQSNLQAMSKFTLFTDYVLNRCDGQTCINYIQNSLANGRARIDRLISWVPLRLAEIARSEAEEQARRLAEEQAAIERARQEEEMRQLQARIEEERRVQAQLQEQQRQAEELRLLEERMREGRRKKKRWYRF